MSTVSGDPSGKGLGDSFVNVSLDGDSSSKLPSIKPGTSSAFENFGFEAKTALDANGTVYINPSHREVNEGLVKSLAAKDRLGPQDAAKLPPGFQLKVESKSGGGYNCTVEEIHGYVPPEIPKGKFESLQASFKDAGAKLKDSSVGRTFAKGTSIASKHFEELSTSVKGLFDRIFGSKVRGTIEMYMESGNKEAHEQGEPPKVPVEEDGELSQFEVELKKESKEMVLPKDALKSIFEGIPKDQIRDAIKGLSKEERFALKTLIGDVENGRDSPIGKDYVKEMKGKLSNALTGGRDSSLPSSLLKAKENLLDGRISSKKLEKSVAKGLEEEAIQLSPIVVSMRQEVDLFSKEIQKVEEYFADPKSFEGQKPKGLQDVTVNAKITKATGAGKDYKVAWAGKDSKVAWKEYIAAEIDDKFNSCFALMQDDPLARQELLGTATTLIALKERITGEEATNMRELLGLQALPSESQSEEIKKAEAEAKPVEEGPPDTSDELFGKLRNEYMALPDEELNKLFQGGIKKDESAILEDVKKSEAQERPREEEGLLDKQKELSAKPVEEFTSVHGDELDKLLQETIMQDKPKELPPGAMMATVARVEKAEIKPATEFKEVKTSSVPISGQLPLSEADEKSLDEIMKGLESLQSELEGF